MDCPDFDENKRTNASENQGDMNDGNAIHTAINNGYFQQVRFLIDQGVNVNERDSTGKTPLILCSSISNDKWAVGLARLLIENGARISICDKEGVNALHHACINQRNLLVEVYLSALDCDVHSKCRKGNTSLHYAASIGNRDILKALVDLSLKYKLTLDPKNKKGWTPLHQAYMTNQIDCGDVLIEFGADETLETEFGKKTGIKLRLEAVERLRVIASLTMARTSSRIVKQIKSKAEKEKPRPSAVTINPAKDFDLRNSPEYVFNITAVSYFHGKDNSRVLKRPKTAVDGKTKDEAWTEEIMSLWDLYETRFSESYRFPAKPSVELSTQTRSDSVVSSSGLGQLQSRRGSKVSKSRAGSIAEPGGSRRTSIAGRRNGMPPLVKTQSRASFGSTGNP